MSQANMSRLAIIDFTIYSRYSGFAIVIQGDWRHWLWLQLYIQ